MLTDMMVEAFPGWAAMQLSNFLVFFRGPHVPQLTFTL